MKIVFGISAGIALYKSLNILRILNRSGHEVRVVLSPSAARLIHPLLFKTLSGGEVFTEDFNVRHPLAHIELGDWADVFAVAPCTANTLASFAHGMAGNLLASSFLACEKRKVIFPAMNTRMYENAATQDNISILRKRGIEVIEPDSGDLACGVTGKGRLPPDEKVAMIIDKDPSAPLSGRNFIVTAGACQEPLDPVRVLSNRSSGRMGIAIARTLYRLGARVTLVHGELSVAPPPVISRIYAPRALNMLNALKSLADGADGLYMAAAVSDYRALREAAQKIKKDGEMTVQLVPNPDLLMETAGLYSKAVRVGFALETSDGVENAFSKLVKKNLDFIALNMLTPDNNPLGSEDNRIILLARGGTQTDSGSMNKNRLADWLVNQTLGLS